MSGKRTKAKVRKVVQLPALIRNELRMTCALKGYNILKSGKSKRLTEQQALMANNYHGRPPNHPPQIELAFARSSICGG